MRRVLLAAVACLVWLPAAAQDNRAATCAVDGPQSPEDAALACGLVIDAAGTTAATQQHALLVQAEIRRRLAQLDLAMTDCDEAIRRDPASAQAFDLRGRVRTDAKQYERALDDFDQAIR